MPDQTASQLRVGDAERERAADQLAEHHAAGRLTVTELDERLDAALSARTRSDLATTLADLPVLAPDRPLVTPSRSVVTRVDPGWTAHLTSYLAVIAGLWLIWALTGFGHPWPVWPMLGWGLGLLGHRTGVSTCSRLRAPARG